MMPHTQLSQNAPPHLQELLFERIATLPGISVRESRVSVPGARAFVLDENSRGPREAFMVDGEFAHLHPPSDGSLHLVLPEPEAREVIEKGWGEPHPAGRMGWVAGTALMVYGPRDEQELESVWTIVRASYRFACGTAGG
jgi:hypothetical protein